MCCGLYIFCSGGIWVQRAGWWVSYRPVRCHPAVADSWGTGTHSHSQTPGGPASGAECRAATVSCGLQHTGLPQPASQGRPGQEAAVGIPSLWSRARLSRLGRAPGPWGRSKVSGERVPHVPHEGALCAAVARLRAGLLRRCRLPYPCLCPLWSRVFGEDNFVLESDPAATWHSRLPCRLPVLHPATQRREQLCQTHLSKSAGLGTTLTLSETVMNKGGMQLYWEFS